MYLLDTKLVKKVILAVPTTPAARLSAPTTMPSRYKSLSNKAIIENHKFVNKTRRAPIISVTFTPALLTNRPPKKNPKIDAITATTLTT